MSHEDTIAMIAKIDSLMRYKYETVIPVSYLDTMESWHGLMKSTP